MSAARKKDAKDAEEQPTKSRQRQLKSSRQPKSLPNKAPTKRKVAKAKAAQKRPVKKGEKEVKRRYSVADLHRAAYTTSRRRRRGKFIAVEANIAAGKTEFCNMLARFWEHRRERQVEVLFEPVDEPTFKTFLDRFQKDPVRWAAMFQLYALKERFQQHTYAAEAAINGKWVIQDRSIFADGCFGMAARNNGFIDDQEWEVYEDLFGHMKRDLRYPDLFVFLEVPPKVCVERATGRGREEEMDTVTLDYFTQIHEQHQMLAEAMDYYTRVLRIDYEHFARGRIGAISDAIDSALATPVKNFTMDWLRL